MLNLSQMHPIQKEIIFRLITNHFLAFSKLKPTNIEGNLFMYHLKRLISEELIQKRNDGLYELTDQGKSFADVVSMSSLKIRSQPKIVTLLICTNSKGEYLLYRRNRHPFIGLIGFPYGKVHLGESVSEAAHRELEEKTGLKAKLTHIGDTYITIHQNHTLISHMLCHIFFTDQTDGKLSENSQIGECFWEKIHNPNHQKYMPGFKDIYQQIKNNQSSFFFNEFTYHI